MCQLAEYLAIDMLQQTVSVKKIVWISQEIRFTWQ